MRQGAVQTADEEISRLAQSGQEICSQNVLPDGDMFSNRYSI